MNMNRHTIEDEPTPIEVKRRREKGMLMAAFNLLSNISGLLAIGLVVFNGGALVERVDNHEKRISHIEASGSPPIAEHIKLDDEREARTRADIVEIKTAAKQAASVKDEVSAVRGELAVVNVKMDALKEQLSRAVRGTQ